MKILDTTLEDLKLIEPIIHNDDRGFFYEIYNQERVLATGCDWAFVQDNLAESSMGVLRGLHFQEGEYAQAKLVTVLEGEIYDVCLDLRPDSSTYGKWEGFLINGKNKRQLFVPRGFAHGYLVTSSKASVYYKVDNPYNKQSEGGVFYNDPELSIDWARFLKSKPLLSEKDKLWPSLAEYSHNQV